MHQKWKVRLQEEDRVTWGLLKVENDGSSHHTLQPQRVITTRQSMLAADIEEYMVEDMQDRRVKRLDKPQLQIML